VSDRLNEAQQDVVKALDAIRAGSGEAEYGTYLDRLVAAVAGQVGIEMQDKFEGAHNAALAQAIQLIQGQPQDYELDPGRGDAVHLLRGLMTEELPK
jgi:hypothetical protein